MYLGQESRYGTAYYVLYNKVIGHDSNKCAVNGGIEIANSIQATTSEILSSSTVSALQVISRFHMIQPDFMCLYQRFLLIFNEF